jgi:hypothetical protein
MRDLMDDEVFRGYMEATPPLVAEHRLLQIPGAWRLWVRGTDDRWRTKRHDSYPIALAQMTTLLARPEVDDVAITSLRVFFGPPGKWVKVKRRYPGRGDQPSTVRIEEKWVPTFAWDDAYYDWCARCRRPSTFRALYEDHHAMRLQPVMTTDDPARCVFCGIRRVALPADPYSIED